MNIERIREYCLSKPLATEDSAFGPEGVLFRVYGKIFAYLDLERPDLVVCKCNPDYAIDLRDKYNAIGTKYISMPTFQKNSSYTSSTIRSLKCSRNFPNAPKRNMHRFACKRAEAWAIKHK